MPGERRRGIDTTCYYRLCTEEDVEVGEEGTMEWIDGFIQ